MKTGFSKSFFWVCALVFNVYFAQSQAINSLTILPTNPTTEDSVKVIASVWIPSGPCWLQQAGVSPIGQDVNVYAGYDAGMLTVICNSTDTVTLGRFGEGTYTCNYNLIYPYFTSAIDDIMSVTFTVSGTSSSGMNENEAAEISCYVTAVGNFHCKYLLPPGEVAKNILIYDAAGRLILSQPLEPANEDDFAISLVSKQKVIILSLETSGGKRYNRLISF
jgi:hypothetical protein